MLRNIFYSTLILGVALIFGVLLLHYFGRSEFDSMVLDIGLLTPLGEGAAKATGYLAVYFLLVLIVWMLTFQFYKFNHRASTDHRRKLDRVAKRLIGSDWRFTASFSISKEEAIKNHYRKVEDFPPDDPTENVDIKVEGTCNISLNANSRLKFDGKWQGQILNGDWHADEIILSDESLKYFFTVPNSESNMGTTEGVTTLRFNSVPRGKIKNLTGQWGVLGAPSWGSIEFNRP